MKLLKTEFRRAIFWCFQGWYRDNQQRFLLPLRLPAECLSRLKNHSLFYPCAGDDLLPVVQLFSFTGDHGHVFNCIGEIDYRYGPTLIWQISKPKPRGAKQAEAILGETERG